MNEEKLNFREDMEIDKDNLHVELARSPHLYAKWAERLVDAENERDQIKDRMELRYSELDMKIRASPSEFGFDEEPKERAIRSKILADKVYQGLQEDYNKAKHEVGVLRIAVKLFKSRDKTIERMIKLYLAKYYVEDYTPKSFSEVDQQDDSGKAQVVLEANIRSLLAFKKAGIET